MTVGAENVVLTFGKYRGKTVGQVAERDVLYLDWLAGLDDLNPALRAAVLEVHADCEAEIEEAMRERGM